MECLFLQSDSVGGSPDVKTEDFIISKRPRLSSITKHRKVEFADYERRLASLQTTVQAIQQAYLGTRERAVVVLEGWDTAGKGGIVRRLGWALDPRSFKVHPISAPSSHEQGKHYLQRFWEKESSH
jgi:AMP-polyphosphate phosphotransferase